MEEIFVSPWGLMDCSDKCSRSWLMSLQGYSSLSLKGHGDWERFLKTERQQISLLSSRRKIWGTRGPSASLQSLGM